MFRKLLVNNYKVKIVSVLLASALWLFVYGGHHPRVSKTLTVPVVYENLPPDLRLDSPPKIIRARMHGDSKLLEEIKQDDLTAMVDLQGLKEGKHVVDVDVTNDTGARMVRRDRTVELVLRRLNKIELPVRISFVGSLPINYGLGRVTFQPERVAVYGSEEELQRVSSVVTTIDLSDRRKSFQSDMPVYAEDVSGLNVTDVTLDPALISINVPIHSENTRIVPITAVYKNDESKDDYPNADYYPATITLIGDEDVLKKIRNVKTEEFDLSKCETGGVFPLRIELPKNVFSNITQVTFSCDPMKELSRSFLVNLRAINLCENCSASIDPGEIEVITEGRADVVKEVKIADIAVFVDLLGVEPGKHEIEPHVSLKRDMESVKIWHDQKIVKVEIKQIGD